MKKTSYIPKPSIAPKKTSASNTEATTLEGKVIGIMDDDPLICKTVELFLYEFGAMLKMIEKAREFEPMLKKRELDLIILDIHMPEINGLDLLKSLKNVDQKIPIVILTASHYEKKLVETAFQRGASGFISKQLLQKESLQQTLLRALSPQTRAGSSPFRKHTIPRKRANPKDDKKE